MQSFRRARRRSAMRVNAEISFTNLIDVAFVLLIIFMITAPIMQGGIELDLPEAAATPLTSAEAVVVSVDRDGRIFFEETSISLEEFGPLIRSHMERRPNDYVLLRGDASTQYGPVVQLLGILMETGVTSVNIAVNPSLSRR
jgi:biopolymer transport protein TolR